MRTARVIPVCLIAFLSTNLSFASNPIEPQTNPQQQKEELKKEVASSAYRLAVNLAKARNEYMTCEVEAYVSTVLNTLAIATNNSNYLRNAARTNEALNTALSSNLVFHELLGNTETDDGFENALSKSKWESPFSGALGPNVRLVFKPGNKLEITRLDWDEENNNPIWKSSEGKYLLFGKRDDQRVTIEANGLIRVYSLQRQYENGWSYQLQNVEDSDDRYNNDPSECDA
jgi:hypothetical protein